MNYTNIFKRDYSIFQYLVLLLSVFPILPYVVRSVVMFMMVIISIPYAFKTTYSDIYSKKLLVIAVLPFFVLVISLIYTGDLGKGIQRLVQMMAFVIFPIVVFLNSKCLSHLFLKRCFNLFAFAVCALVLYQIIYCLASWDYIFSNPTKLEIKNLNLTNIIDLNNEIASRIKLRRFRNFIIEISDTHTTYQGIWVVFALAIIFKNRIKNKALTVKITLTVLGVILIAWLFIISSRSPLIGLIIASIITLSRYLKNQLTIKSILIFFVSALVGLSFIYKTLPGFKLKVDELVNTKLELPTNGIDIYNFNATNVRYGIYYCSLKIIKDNLLLGVGIGDLQRELNNCYSSMIGAKVYKWNDYNTHNQFLFFFAASGIIGFVLFLLSVLTSLYIAFKSNELMFLFFILSISIILLTENVLSRSDGVIFYSFFNSMMLFNSTLNKKNDSN